ncbi:MAG: tol-pal system protein YbgF, partial [Gammaproteobacteria bacterium]
NSWQLYSQMQQMQEEVAQLRGMVEEQGHLIERLQNDLRTRYTDLDQRLQVQQDRLQTPPAADVAATGTGKAATSSVEEEKKAYLAAYDTFRSGGADKAIAPMLAFVKQYPDSSLTPGAHYWLGEFYLNASRPDQVKARQQFDTVLAEYPDNSKAPAALYKIASILDLQGKPDEARQKMQELMKRYPKSPEASLADTWLKTLQAAQAPAKPAARPVSAKPAANKR